MCVRVSEFTPTLNLVTKMWTNFEMEKIYIPSHTMPPSKPRDLHVLSKIFDTFLFSSSCCMFWLSCYRILPHVLAKKTQEMQTFALCFAREILPTRFIPDLWVLSVMCCFKCQFLYDIITIYYCIL